MPIKQTYYKVVDRTFLGELKSARICGYALTVTYKPDIWTTPNMPNSKLFVFNSLDAARDFRSCAEQIWECEVKNPRQAKYFSGRYTLEEFWSFSPSKRVAIYKKLGHKIPTGTIFADAVKLTKQVD